MSVERGIHDAFFSPAAENQAGVLPIALVDPQTEAQQHVLFVTGTACPEAYLHPMAKSLAQSGAVPHDLEHFIPANIVIGVENRLADRAKELADQTGERVPIIGYSLGGTFAARLQQRQPELVDRVITVASPVSPVLGIQTPTGERAVSIFSFADIVVPWPLSLNDSFGSHHPLFTKMHWDIVFSKKVAGLVRAELSTPVPTQSQPTPLFERISAGVRGTLGDVARLSAPKNGLVYQA